ncbi:hypothetical protein [Leptospira interrogans]|uniref:hypothetical protein n=1 Tax=Leptospira interrogans TaxID=173 RepID=UPI001F0F7EE2|nr:hypothetical protein [Leptospira interrogans]UMQ57656.1 hypothetical protein FH585_15595 [Leptospira interrogans]UNE64998.1 hypothetical protein FH588_01555 [Leptospira interrogans]
MKKIYVLLILLLLQNCATTLLKNAAPVTTPTKWLFEISEVYSKFQYALDHSRYYPKDDNETMVVVEVKATVVAKTENVISVVKESGITLVEPNQSVKRDMVFVFPEKMKPEKLFIQNVGEINLLEQQNPVPR